MVHSFRAAIALFALASAAACAPEAPSPPTACSGAAAIGAMIAIPGGRFTMGAENFYPEERPLRDVVVEGFSIQAHEVTNAQFSAFVAATGYVTVAERPLDARDFPTLSAAQRAPGSLVFAPRDDVVDLNDFTQWWAWRPGASWRHPAGPDSSLAGLENHPVVHVAFEDAMAYARWAGAALPSEAQWERAARGGLNGADYVWGDRARDAQGRPRANHWQGVFPMRDAAEDGYAGAAPVGCFEPNGFGLYDMAGNVWELTTDDYADARGPQPGAKVGRGGSFLCSDTYCGRYRPAARIPIATDSGMQHVGFRVIARP